MAYTPHKIIRDKIAKEKNRKQLWLIFFVEALLFLVPCVLAVTAVFKLNIKNGLASYLPETVLQKLFLYLVAIIFCLFIVFFPKNKKLLKYSVILYKVIFVVIFFCGIEIILNIFAPIFVSILIAGFFIFIWLKNPIIATHNIMMALAVAGLALFLGYTVTPPIIIALLLLFSVYRFFSIEKPKKEHTFFSFLIPQNLTDFKETLSVSRLNVKYLFLSGIDIVLPCSLIVSISLTGFLRALVAFIISLAGYFMSSYFISEEKSSMLALPPIALFTILGYLAVLFF